MPESIRTAIADTADARALAAGTGHSASAVSRQAAPRTADAAGFAPAPSGWSCDEIHIWLATPDGITSHMSVPRRSATIATADTYPARDARARKRRTIGERHHQPQHRFSSPPEPR
jgi:hypothetical protein